MRIWPGPRERERRMTPRNIKSISQMFRSATVWASFLSANNKIEMQSFLHDASLVSLIVVASATNSTLILQQPCCRRNPERHYFSRFFQGMLLLWSCHIWHLRCTFLAGVTFSAKWAFLPCLGFLGLSWRSYGSWVQTGYTGICPAFLTAKLAVLAMLQGGSRLICLQCYLGYLDTYVVRISSISGEGQNGRAKKTWTRAWQQ